MSLLSVTSRKLGARYSELTGRAPRLIGSDQSLGTYRTPLLSLTKSFAGTSKFRTYGEVLSEAFRARYTACQDHRLMIEAWSTSLFFFR